MFSFTDDNIRHNNYYGFYVFLWTWAVSPSLIFENILNLIQSILIPKQLYFTETKVLFNRENISNLRGLGFSKSRFQISVHLSTI